MEKELRSQAEQKGNGSGLRAGPEVGADGSKGERKWGANDIRESGSSGESTYCTGFRRISGIINIGGRVHFVQGAL